MTDVNYPVNYYLKILRKAQNLGHFKENGCEYSLFDRTLLISITSVTH